jgi:hypothetical protein
MKEPKVEKQMKALLEARRIKPSKGLWEHLENELPNQSSRKRKAYRIAFSLAGLLLLLLGLRFSFQELPIGESSSSSASRGGRAYTKAGSSCGHKTTA